MNSQPLSLNTRLRAATCHFASLAWVPIELTLSPLIKIVNRDLTWVGIARFYTPVVAMILANLIVILLWKVNQKVHPFIDRSGRCATNFILSSSLILIITSNLLGMTCGIPFYVKRAESALASSYLISLLLLIYAIFSIGGTIFTLGGKVASYPLTVKFLSETP